MDENWMGSIEVEISKLNFLLENLYAITLKDHGATPENVDEFSEELCRQAMLPARPYGSQPEEQKLLEFQEKLSHRLAMFLAAVRDRVSQETES